MKIRQFLALLLAAALLTAPPAAAGAYYDDHEAVTAAVPPSAAAIGASLTLNAGSALLVERETGQVLYEKNADAPRAIASITKVMTMILVMEAIESGRIALEDEVTASHHAYETGGAQIWLEPGEVMTVDQLLRAVAVASANDAAVALAEYVGGSEEVFVADMNRKAAELGMTGTTFKNCNGLDEPGHISCARDVAVMSREVLRHELIRRYITIWQDTLRGGKTELTNTNKLLKRYNGITGIKTGTTDDAGVCITASAERGGMELIAVVLGSPSGKDRFDAATALLDFGFAHFELADVAAGFVCPPPAVAHGQTDTVPLAYRLPEHIVVEKGKKEQVSVTAELRGGLCAPIAAGEPLGEICILCGSDVLLTVPVTAAGPVARVDFLLGLRLLLRELAWM